MYFIEPYSEPGVIRITFDYWIALGETDPFFAFVKAYAKANSFSVRTAEIFYNYKLIGGDCEMQLIWNGGFKIYAFVYDTGKSAEIREGMVRICKALNREINIKKRF